MRAPRYEEIRRWLARCPEPFILIDAGGVMFNNVTEDSTFIEDAARCLGLSPSALLAAYCSGEDEFEVARSHVHDAIDRQLEALGHGPLTSAQWELVDRLYVAAVRPNTPVLRALRDFDGGGSLVLANNEAEHWDQLKHAAFGHLDLFSHLASSWRMGACKPTAAYFDAVGRLLHPAPAHQWHLLDDNPEVIEAARSYGLRATMLGTLSAG